MTTTFIDSPRLNEVALQKTRNGSYKMELELPTRPMKLSKENHKAIILDDPFPDTKSAILDVGEPLTFGHSNSILSQKDGQQIKAKRVRSDGLSKSKISPRKDTSLFNYTDSLPENSKDFKKKPMKIKGDRKLKSSDHDLASMIIRKNVITVTEKLKEKNEEKEKKKKPKPKKGVFTLNKKKKIEDDKFLFEEEPEEDKKEEATKCKNEETNLKQDKKEEIVKDKTKILSKSGRWKKEKKKLTPAGALTKAEAKNATEKKPPTPKRKSSKELIMSLDKGRQPPVDATKKRNRRNSKAELFSEQFFEPPKPFDTPTTLLPNIDIEDSWGDYELTEADKKDGKAYSWSDFSLPKQYPKFETGLPKELEEEFFSLKVNQSIDKKRYYGSKKITVALYDARVPTMELIGELFNLYPNDIEIKYVYNTSDALKDVLESRYENVEFISTSNESEIFNKDVQWIFVDGFYCNLCNTIIKALNAGKNVYCPKPLCFSIDDCLRLKNVVAASGKSLLSSFVWRRSSFYLEVKRIIKSKIFGSVISVELNNLLSIEDGGKLFSNWTRKKELVGSSLFELCLFEIDILCWLLDSIPSKVAAFSDLLIYNDRNCGVTPTSNDENRRAYMQSSSDVDFTYENYVNNPFISGATVNDCFSFIIEFRNETKCSFHVNTNSFLPQKRILICGTGGTLEGDLCSGIIKYKPIGIGTENEMRTVNVSPNSLRSNCDSHLASEFVQVSVKGYKPTNLQVEDNYPCNGLDIFPSLVTILGIDQSREKNSVIDLEEYWKQLQI